MNSTSTPLTYSDSGVDIDTADAFVQKISPLASETRRKGSLDSLGGFGGCFDLKACGFKDPILVAGTDGVGTKLRLAQESGILHNLGIDLVAMCVNDIIVQGAEPLFFLDYMAVGKLDPAMGVSLLEGVANGCMKAGCALLGGETAEMPGVYHKQDFDLAGFAVGAVERESRLPDGTLEVGDVLIGLPSNGAHSNGYSLIRKIIEKNAVKLKESVPFATTARATWQDVLLTPTRIYVEPVLKTLRSKEVVSLEATSSRRAIVSMAHITGGGLTGNISRVLQKGFAAHINLEKYDCPYLFRWLAKHGPVEPSEMLRTFNCGIGFVLVCPANAITTVKKVLFDMDEKPVMLGEIIKREDGKDAIQYSGDTTYFNF